MDNKEVLVPKEAKYMGKMVDVDIVETGKHYLKGQVVSERLPERPVSVPPPLKQGQVSGLPNNSNKPDYDRHPVWVQMAVVVVAVAFILRAAIFVFNESG